MNDLRVVLLLQLQRPSVLRRLRQQSMTPSQRQTFADLLEQNLPGTSDTAFNPELLARYA